MQHLVQGAGEVVEQSGGVRLVAGVPRRDGDHDPVVSDAVEEAVAVGHHGSHGPQDGGVAHQTGRQREVTASTAP